MKISPYTKTFQTVVFLVMTECRVVLWEIISFPLERAASMYPEEHNINLRRYENLKSHT
jgi:hypothetical protein